MRRSLSVKEKLLTFPFRFEFTQASYLLMRETQRKKGLFFRSMPSFSHSSSDIISLKKEDGLFTEQFSKSLTAETNFLSLWNHNSALPYIYIDWLSKSGPQKRMLINDFLDIFSNRLNHLFFDIQKKFYPFLDLSLPNQTALGELLLSLSGIKEHRSESLSPRYFLALSHFFWKRPRNAATLERILSIFLGVRVGVKSFSGGWRHLPASHLTRLGLSAHNIQLSENFLLGRRAWLQDQALGVRLFLGEQSMIQDFLPEGQVYNKIKALVACYVGCGPRVFLALSFTFNKPRKLGDSERGFYLGWSSVLGIKKLNVSFHFGTPLLD